MLVFGIEATGGRITVTGIAVFRAGRHYDR